MQAVTHLGGHSAPGPESALDRVGKPSPTVHGGLRSTSCSRVPSGRPETVWFRSGDAAAQLETDGIDQSVATPHVPADEGELEVPGLSDVVE